MLDCKCKIPRRKHGGNLHDIGLGNDFMDMTARAQVTMTDYVKLKSLFIAQETINRVKRHPTERGWKMVQPLWKTEWRFLKKIKNRTTIWSSNPLLGIYPKELKSGS